MSRLHVVWSWIGLGISSLVLFPLAAAGQILLCDRISNQILEYNLNGSFLRNVVGTDSPLPDGPSGMAFGTGNDLFVSSINDGRVLRYNWKTGAAAATPFATGLNGPSGVLFDKSTNSLYVSEFGNFDGHEIVRFDATSGQETGRFDAGTGGGFAGMALGNDGKLYVSNFYLGQVLKFDPANTATPPVVFASNSALQGSNGLLFDSSGKLDVVGLLSQNVYQFNANGTSAKELIPTATQALYFPADAVLDPDGNLLVSCLGNNSDPRIPFAPGYVGKFNAATGAAINVNFILSANDFQPTAMLIEPYAVWTGGMTGNRWTSAANWGGSPPLDPAAVRFGSTTTGGFVTTNNDFAAGTQFNGITFTGDNTSYTLAGKAIKLGGPVVNQSAINQTVNLDMEIVLGGGTFDTGANNITIGGKISGTGSLTKTGSGILTLNGDLSYTGSTTVTSGSLIVEGALTQSPDITVTGAETHLRAASIVAETLTINSGTNAGSAQSVPEPSAIVLALLGGLGLLLRIFYGKSDAVLHACVELDAGSHRLRRRNR
jgi:autotransporter-associated beta strand protein